MEQPAQEVAWMTRDHLGLPRLEHDRALMLATPPVLGKQTQPVFPRDRDDCATGNGTRVRPATGFDTPHQLQDVLGQPDVRLVVVDMQLPDLTASA